MTGEKLLREELAKQLQDPRVLLVGEAAGVFGRSLGLSGKTMALPLSEGATVGTAVGLAIAGKKPIVELLDGAGLGRAFGALAEAADLIRRSEGSFSVPLVVLAPAPARLPEFPEGICCWAAADPSDASLLLAEALKEGKPAIILLSEEALRENVEAKAQPEPAKIVGSGKCTVVAWGKGVMEARQVEGVEVVELRRIWPLQREKIGESVRRTGRVVVVGAPSLLPLVVEEGFLYLESPPILADAHVEAIAKAVRQSIDY